MSGKLDGRSQEMVRAQLMRRAAALLGPGGAPVEPGAIESALIAAAARMMEEVTRRLDKVPEKQADNFYAAMGIGRDPALPARVPVAIKLADTAPTGLVALAGTKLTADTGPTPTIFETERGIALARGKVTRLAAANLDEDKIYLAPVGVVTPTLPPLAAVARNIRSAAGPGATSVQVDPALGLGPGVTIRFTAAATPEYDITEVKNDVVSFAPALTETVAKGAPVLVVDRFAPFAAGARDRQGHAIYLSHPTMLDVAGALTISIAGVEWDQPINWEWFGSGADGAAADWQSFTKSTFVAGQWALEKPQGKPEKTTVDGHNALWIRARLDGGSGGSSHAGNITMAVSSGGLCARDLVDRCAASDATLPAIAYDAVAVTTPVVPNKPYYPFGREPRLYDSFYVGCKEAFGKAGAEVSLCLSLGALERAAAVAWGEMIYYFGLGTDQQLYAAQFGGAAPTFSTVSGPRDGDLPAELPDQAHISARIDGDWVRIAIAGVGAVYYAQFLVGTDLKGQLPWLKLPAASEDATVPMGPLFVSADGRDTVHAMVGTDRVMSWQRDGSGPLQPQPAEKANDLIAVQGSDMALLLVDEDEKWRVRIKPGTQPDTTDGALLESSDLPGVNRAAWFVGGNGANTRFGIAGYDEDVSKEGESRLSLVRLGATGTGATIDVGTCRPLPITFESPEDESQGWEPGILVATATPARFLKRDGAYQNVGGIESIGESASAVRQILFAGGRAMVQRWDRGLLYRAAPGDQLQRPLEVTGVSRQVAADRDVPSSAQYFVDEHAPDGAGYLIANSSGDRLLLALTNHAAPFSTDRDGWFLASASETGQLQQNGNTITLLPATVPGTASGNIDVLLSIASQPHGIWRLEPDNSSVGWQQPAGAPPLPTPTGNNTITYQLLSRFPDIDLGLSDYFVVDHDDVIRLARALRAGPLRVVGHDAVVTEVTLFGSYHAIRLDRDLPSGGVISLSAAGGIWTELGLSEPANPALSWEYWNGESWWALDTDAFGFTDRTANLQLSQGVFFNAPTDLSETEVGGRKNLWIRARLVGGDYGEARVTVASTESGGKTEQTVTRDLSAIRAPYVISLRINYCVAEPVNPALVITADNLGTIDQTNANDAGLPVTIFPTVAEALAPQAQPAPEANAVPDCCRELSLEPDATTPISGSTVTGAARALLVGFDQPITGSPLSLFVDAIPSGDWEIEAAMYRAGRFEPARILGDTSSGLGEGGVIAIEIDQPPDRSALFGASAYWLRLTPSGDTAADWGPQVRGVHLNGVVAASVETRAIETIGTSSGEPGQTFRLFAAPIDPGSLTLCVLEPVGEDETLMLGAAPEIAGMPGPWVAWKMVNEFPPEGSGDPARLFTVDAEAGTITFGNGRNALVPPMGGAVLALGYHHVGGTAANAVRAGAKLQPVSPIAGIDQVIALDGAAGGVDVELAGAARGRAPAKLANGGRILTLADIENHVGQRNPAIAQARAENRHGAIRLIVVGRGERLIPPPSALKAIARDLRTVSSYGLAAPDRLRVVAPRLLPIAIDLNVQPDPGVDLVGIEEEAKAAIAAVFDHQSGGFGGSGWPVGALPTIDDIAAVLAPLGDRAVISGITVRRADPTQSMPDPFPTDVLVRIERTDIHVSAYEEATA